MRRLVVGVTALLVVLAGCSSPLDDPDTSDRPTFGSSATGSPDADPTGLAAAKADAGIEDCPASDGDPATSGGLPDLVLDCLGGGSPVELARLTGTPLVLNYWASWCGPCREEMPLLARLDGALGDRVRIIGVDMDDPDPADALELAAASGVTFPLLSDPDSDSKVPLKVVGLPQTVFVDADGRVVATERVPFRSYDDLLEAVTKHLGVEP